MSIYNDYFGFKETPFSLTPDPEFLFLSSVHREALAYLRYGLREKKGFVLITGEVGSGKTTLLRALLKDVHREVRTALIINPRVEFDELIRAIFTDLEIDIDLSGANKTEMLDTFYDCLLDEHEAGHNVVLIIDEAQHLSMPVLEEIRMLSNFETAKEKLLQIIFVGQPELRQRLAMPQLRQLRQRITVRFHIDPLSLEETREYILHRLHVAQTERDDIFVPEAVEHIYEFSGGIPRLINVVCDAALLAAFADGKTQVDGETALVAVSEQEEYEKGLDVFSRPKPDPADVAPTNTESSESEVKQEHPDSTMLFDLARTVLRLENELAERSAQLSDVMEQLGVRVRDLDRRLAPKNIRSVASGEEMPVVLDSTDAYDHTADLMVAVEKLELCLDMAGKLAGRLGFDADEDADSKGGSEKAVMERKVRLNCSQCDGERYIVGTFCRHCWERIRRIKMSGILDS